MPVTRFVLHLGQRSVERDTIDALSVELAMAIIDGPSVHAICCQGATLAMTAGAHRIELRAYLTINIDDRPTIFFDDNGELVAAIDSSLADRLLADDVDELSVTVDWNRVAQDLSSLPVSPSVKNAP